MSEPEIIRLKKKIQSLTEFNVQLQEQVQELSLKIGEYQARNIEYQNNNLLLKVQKEKDGNYEFISFKELSSVWRSLSATARKAKEERENEILSIKKRIEEQGEEMYWRTYGYSHKEYNGVYSDDAISDAFDGDPSACWNTD